MFYNVKTIRFRDGVTDTHIYRHGLERGRKKVKLDYEKKQIIRKTRENEDDRRRSVSRTKQQIYALARNQKWDWFVTLTLDPRKIDRYDYDVTTKKLSKWLNNLRKLCPDMKYIFVPEQHEDGAYHFHGLMANVDTLRFVDSKHTDKIGRVIYNLENYRYGWSTATPVSDNDSVIHYISKYITKELLKDTKGKKHYWRSRNLDLPQVDLTYLDEPGKCFLWQELIQDCSYMKETNNFWNGVMYFKNEPVE